MRLAHARKAAAALATAGAELLAAGLWHGDAAIMAQAVVGLLGTVAVYQVRNAPPPGHKVIPWPPL